MLQSRRYPRSAAAVPPTRGAGGHLSVRWLKSGEVLFLTAMESIKDWLQENGETRYLRFTRLMNRLTPMFKPPFESKCLTSMSHYKLRRTDSPSVGQYEKRKFTSERFQAKVPSRRYPSESAREKVFKRKSVSEFSRTTFLK